MAAARSTSNAAWIRTAAPKIARLASKRAELEAQRAECRVLEQEERLAYVECLALDAASNAVVDLIEAGKRDEAEADREAPTAIANSWPWCAKRPKTTPPSFLPTTLRWLTVAAPGPR